MFYAINKPKNISSFNEIKKFANENNIKKIGHCGTLDPLASGLLIVATNEHTKLIDYIYSSYKCYKVSVKLHFSSPSYDEGSEVLKLKNNQILTKKMLLEALKLLQTTKTQIPPIFSAKKINGIRAYEYARKNKEINLKSINIDIR
jgi:tRNA pseudouridine synthase B